jgi:DNA (cytosine-5)-methyltransferase 1
MKYATLCSGIEAPSMGWDSLGWKPVFFSEIEPFPKAVLKHHYPEVPDYGDMTKYKKWEKHDGIELICAGTPCQAFSVAGLRKGIEDPRGNLTLTFLGVLERYRPTWVVWENVPGVLSDRTNAFGQFIAGLSELGYSCAWRVLDAQYFGVPQRRRRVFVVGCLGNWRAAASVLFERHSLSGDSAPSREKRQGIAGTTQTCAGTGGEVTGALVARDYKGVSNTNSIDDNKLVISFDERNIHLYSNKNEETSPGLTATDYKGAKSVAHTFKIRSGCEGGGKGYLGQDEAAFTLDTTQSQNLMHRTAIRRLTPVECERLQGFPDNYTQIPYRNKPPHQCPDGPRYKALGNSMAVPVLKWIGERINEINKLL